MHSRLWLTRKSSVGKQPCDGLFDPSSVFVILFLLCSIRHSDGRDHLAGYPVFSPKMTHNRLLISLVSIFLSLVFSVCNMSAEMKRGKIARSSDDIRAIPCEPQPILCISDRSRSPSSAFPHTRVCDRDKCLMHAGLSRSKNNIQSFVFY